MGKESRKVSCVNTKFKKMLSEEEDVLTNLI